MKATDNNPADGSLGDRVRPVSDPISVPVFNCVVYLSHAGDRVSGRVANLPQLTAEGDSEPAVLRQLVSEFKQRITRYQHDDVPIPSVEPPSELAADEVKRLIPVHL